ncbi:MAG: ATP-dependent DNA helicase RecQ [Planctomycetota bacterium]
MAGTDPRIAVALRERFGLEALRGHQAAAIDAVLAGRDVLVTMPTGAGKSLIYQLPALVLDGLTLVVSPLIALMKDQVDALRARGIAATFVNSSLERRERAARLEAAQRGEYDLLFVTPERFRSAAFLAALPALRITRLAVDEAHCISQWGHDFRPDYSRLGLYRASLLARVPTVALTATATPDVADDIVARLGLTEPLVLRSGIERENLFLACTEVDDEEQKLDVLAARLREVGGAGIVYASLIKDLERMHGELLRRGLRTLVYHGGLSPEERRRMQERFMASDDAIVLATNAFGMGVDKADVRFVIHAQLPRTLEAFAQEVGRAGRDGRPAWCELLYLPDDIAIQETFVRWANPTLEYILLVYETLRGWGERLQVKDEDDLRQELLVKERRDNRLGITLKWLEVLGVTRGSFETRDLALVRALDPNELPEFVGTGDKLKADLMALLTMVRFATDRETPRRVALARHFGLPDEGDELTRGCDVSEDGAAWRAQHLAPRAVTAPGAGPARAGGPPSSGEPAGAEPRNEESPRFQRGDFVRVDGRHLGQVLRVDGRGRSVKLLVEGLDDMRRRTVDPRRQRVERIDG